MLPQAIANISASRFAGSQNGKCGFAARAASSCPSCLRV